MTQQNPKTTLLVAGMAILVSSAIQAQDSSNISQSINMAAYYAKGDYGEDVDTTVLYVPLTYELSTPKWGFDVVLPYIDVNGLSFVFINSGGNTTAVAGTQITNERGLGDVVASATYKLDPISNSAPFIDLRFSVKLPTADEMKALGTGETDYSFQVDLSQPIGDTFLFASVGYYWRGETSLFEGLVDSAFVQLGVDYSLTSKLSMGAFYDYREKASTEVAEIHEISPYFSWKLSDKWIFTGLASWGFTDASADMTVLGQFSYRW